MDGIITTTTNFKSKVIEWSQKESKEVDFEMLSVSGNSRFKEFHVQITINGEILADGKGATKKKAEQDASKNACEKLKLDI